MAIQFFCPGCRQPIEVDQELANLAVTCPYCRKVVTAPEATDPVVTDAATARGPTAAQSPSIPGSPPPMIRQPGTGKLGFFALACLTFSIVAISVLFSSMKAVIDQIPQSEQTPKEINRVMAEEMNARPGLVKITFAGFCAVPIGAVCAVIALVKKNQPRWPAITTLVVVGLLFLTFCLSFALQMGQAAGAR